MKTEKFKYKSYFPVIKGRISRLIRLILNTTGKDHEGYRSPFSYIPMDPKYIYTETYGNKNRYEVGLPSYSQNDQSLGTTIEDLLMKRNEIIDSKIGMLFSEIYSRHRIKEDNLYRIDLDQCAFRNLVFETGEHMWDRQRIELESNIIDLEEQKRRERVNYFKDILFLKKELRESLIEKLEEEQKTGLLMN